MKIISTNLFIHMKFIKNSSTNMLIQKRSYIQKKKKKLKQKTKT